MSQSSITCVFFPCGKTRLDIRAMQSLQMQISPSQICVCPLHGEMEQFSTKLPPHRIIETFDEYLPTLGSAYLTLLFSPNYFISPDSIARQIAVLEANPDADVCQAHCIAEPILDEANSGSSSPPRNALLGLVFRSIVAQSISERFPGILEAGGAPEILARGEYTVATLDLSRTISQEAKVKQL